MPALKWIISILVIAYVVYEFIIQFSASSNVIDLTIFSNSASLTFFLLFIIIGFFNILIEAFKWQYLVKPFEKLSLNDSISCVFTGLTLAIISPSRIGDFIGKAVQLKQINSSKGIVIALLGHAAQFIVILLLGTMSIGHFYKLSIGFIYFVQILLIIIALTLYFKLPSFLKFLSRFALFENIQDSLTVLDVFTLQQKIIVLIYSILKYLMFVFQFYLLLLFFGVPIGIENAIIAIFCTYLVQLLVPSFLLLELGVRGAAAVYFLGTYSSAIPQILLSTYLLWTLNIAVPAVIGLYFFNKKSN